VNDELTLRDVALAACEKHEVAGGRALGRVAGRLELRLSYTTVDRILAGTYLSRPKPDLLDNLAILSGISKERVYRAAGQPMAVASLAEQLPPDADLLTADQRRAVLSIVRSLAAANRAVAELQSEVEHQDAQDPRDEKSSAQSSPDGGVQQPDRQPPIEDQPELAAVSNIRPGITGRGTPPYVDRAPGVDRSKWAASKGKTLGQQREEDDEAETDALNRDPEGPEGGA